MGARPPNTLPPVWCRRQRKIIPRRFLISIAGRACLLRLGFAAEQKSYTAPCRLIRKPVEFCLLKFPTQRADAAWSVRLSLSPAKLIILSPEVPGADLVSSG